MSYDGIAGDAARHRARFSDRMAARGIDATALWQAIAADVIANADSTSPDDMASILSWSTCTVFESFGYEESASPYFLYAHMAMTYGFLGLEAPAFIAVPSSYEAGENIRTLVDAMLEDES